MTVNSPIINYNDGFLSINHVFDSLVFPAVLFFNANQKDDAYSKNMGRKSLEKNKKSKGTQITKEGFYRSRKGK